MSELSKGCLRGTPGEKLTVPSELLPKLYSGLTQTVAGTGLSLGVYGNHLLEGLRKFQESLEGFFRKESVTISIETTNPFEKSPIRLRLDDPITGLKGRLDGIIEGEKKRAKAGDRGKEDDLLNMSNLGMTLLNISSDGMGTSRELPLLNDSQNLLADLYPTSKGPAANDLSLVDAPNLNAMNDDLLDFDNMYGSQGGTTQPRASYTASKKGSNQVESLSFKKPPGIPLSSLRTTLPSQHQFVNGQVVNGYDRSPMLGSVSRNTEYSVKTPVRPSTLNRPSSSSSHNSSMEKKAAKTAVEYTSTSEYWGRSLRSPTLPSTAGTESASVSSYTSGLAQSKSSQQYSSSTKQPSKKTVTGLKSFFPDDLLTPQARELMKNIVHHKGISSRFHTDLFNLMDQKNRPYDFSDSQMGDSGAHFIWKYLKKGLEIETLKLDNCKITDVGLSILLHGLSNIKVTKLYLRDNLITREGVDLLLQFVTGYHILERLHLEGNSVDKHLLSTYVKEFATHHIVLSL